MSRIGAFAEKRHDVLAGVLGLVSVIVALGSFFPDKIAGLPMSIRVVIGLVVAVCAMLVFWGAHRRRKSRKESESSAAITKLNAADGLLRIVQSECVESGEWRITLLREGLDDRGKRCFHRVHRLAQHSEYSSDGAASFLQSQSVLREIDSLDFGPGSEPVNFRQNFPDKRANANEWVEAHRQYVGDRVSHLRFESRSFGWRRVEVMGTGKNPHVLLVESTAPEGIKKQGLKNPILDKIAESVLELCAEDFVSK